MSNTISSFLTFLGLARRAGRVICGTELVLTELRHSDKIKLVICSTKASDATKKRVSDKCSYYKKDLLLIDADTAALGKSLGKSSLVAAVAVTDEGFAKELKKRADDLADKMS